MREWHRVCLKSMCPSERQLKTSSAWILVYLRGGVSFLCQCAVSLLSHSFVCAALHSFPSNKCSLASHFVRPFFSFSLPRRLYINRAPSSLPFVPSSHSRSTVSLSLLILSSGFPGCKWQTSRVVRPSKKPCCYHLAINPFNVSMYGNSVGHKTLSSTGGMWAYTSVIKERKMRGCREILEWQHVGEGGMKD